MSRGEITIEDNQFKPAGISAPGDWAAEYEQQHSGGRSWADQFSNEQASSDFPKDTMNPCLWQKAKMFRSFTSMLRTFLLHFLVLISDDILQSAKIFSDLMILTIQLSHGPHGWANEFATERGQQGSTEDEWANEFSKLNVNDWSDEFERQVTDGVLGDSSGDNWANAYDE